jgi:hypothetical protein
MKERVRPYARKVDMRGVDTDGKGVGVVSVMAEGVRVFVFVGDGGKTNSVCEGV